MILFLDIDGVLNSSRSVFVKIGPDITKQAVLELSEASGGLPYGAAFGLKTVDPVCVALVNRLLEETGASLVLSSTHRMFFTDEHTQYGSDAHLRLLRQYLEVMGVRVPEAFSITTRLHKQRGDEVELWMNMAYENGLVGDDTRYVILDDGRDFHDSQPLVWCDPEYGLNFANYAEACRQLGTNEPGLILL